jgi:large conductance mechanosensitive channel
VIILKDNNKIKSNTKNLKKEIKRKSKEAEVITKKAIDDYKKFAIKGNILDLAIGVVIGGAFTNIVNNIVTSIITPLLSILTNKVDISTLFINLSDSNVKSIDEAKQIGTITLNYGLVLNSILNFFIVSLVLFIVFKYISKLRTTTEKNEQEEIKETTKVCPYCKSNIHLEATRCSFCTSKLD